MGRVWVLSLAGPGIGPVRLTVCRPLFSTIVRLVRAVNVGGSFTGVTVNRKDELAEANPSLTVRVSVADPKAFVLGMIVTVRLLLLPPKTMFVIATRVVSELAAERTNESAEVSRSPIVKAIGPTTESSFVVRSLIAEIMGWPFTLNVPLKPLDKPAA